MLRMTLRRKLGFFAAIIAVVPILVAGQTLLRIAQDELKSSANDQLVNTARQIAGEIDSVYERAWLAPLLLVRNAIDNSSLGVEEKIAILTLGIKDLPEVVALQITLGTGNVPLLLNKEGFAERLSDNEDAKNAILRTPPSFLVPLIGNDQPVFGDVSYLAKTDDWIATIALPLSEPLAEQPAILSAKINLKSLSNYVNAHPFAKTGDITLIDEEGHRIFTKEREDLTERAIAAEALKVLKSNSRALSVKPYSRPDGTVMLGAYSFPGPIHWAILVEKNEADAYLPITIMLRSLVLWVSIGLAVAVIGALFFAHRISRPILAVGEAAIEVGQGNFKARIPDVRGRDEIADLANRFNTMIEELSEREELQKFVSGDTLAAIRTSEEGVDLGGERKNVAILFADIRGYTAFAETRDPETVVDVLNSYFQSMADLVIKHGGDIDKFVGDQIMAVFQGRNRAKNAVLCAVDIQDEIIALAKKYPDGKLQVGVGIDVGEVVMGAMGSTQRMDYTVLGDHVNLAARLCGKAPPKKTIISAACHKGAAKTKGLSFKSLKPISVKGKSQPIEIFEVNRSKA